MMRAVLLLIPVLLTSCGPVISQREVLGRARAEVVLREPWAESAVVLVKERPSYPWSSWRIEAGALDYSGYPIYEGLDLVPGSGRELRFGRDGCLLSYKRRSIGCTDRYRPASAATATRTDK